MLRTIFSLCLLLLTFTTAKAQYNITTSNSTKFEISAEKPTYYVNEPLKLTLSFKNEGTQTVTGYFGIRSLAPNIKIYYRKAGKEFEPYNFTYQHGTTPTGNILPNTNIHLTAILLFDTKQKKFALSSPGLYEIKASYSENISGTEVTTDSNILTIQIINSTEQKNAVDLYSIESIARLIQNDEFDDSKSYQQAVDKATLLAKNYPDSLYTKILRHFKLAQLHYQKSRHKCEQDLYVTLKQYDTEDILEEKTKDNDKFEKNFIEYMLKASQQEENIENKK